MMESGPPKVHSFKAHDLPFSSVIVYSDRAEVKRKLSAKIDAGAHEILVEGISENVNPDSVRVDGRGSAIIHEVQFQCKPALPSDTSSPRIKKLEEEREALNAEKLVKEDLQKVLMKRIDALDHMVVGQVSGSNSSEAEKGRITFDEDSLANISKLFDFFEKNSLDVRKRVVDVNEELRKINEKIAKLDGEIGQIRCLQPMSRNVSVLIVSEEGGEIELDVSYQVWGARWSPSYDIRVACAGEEKTKMKVTYYGKIQQCSGEDWTEVPLILSTAQPSLGGNIPELGTLNAVFQSRRPSVPHVPQRALGSGAIRHRKVMAMKMSDDMAFEECAGAVLPEMGMGYALSAPLSAGDTVLSTMFSVPRPATIPSDTSEHKVTITVMDLSPKMLHECVPSKDTNVYLMASLINETTYPFLAGEAAVYLDNSFVAKTNIKSVSPGERFVCSLGVDMGVKVDYKPAHKYREQIGILSKSASIAHEQKIVVKNNKMEDILITLKEHFPKSTDEKIKINLLLPKLAPDSAVGAEALKQGQLPSVGARLNKANNLEWTIHLQPNKEAELVVKWSVEHPNGETVDFQEAF